MTTTTDFMAYVVEQARLDGRLTTRRMFGEFAVYVDGRVVGFLADNSLFIKYFEATTALTAALPAGQAYPGSKPYAIADEWLDDPVRLQALLLATADAAPPPKPKRVRRPKAPAGEPDPRA